MDVIAPGLLRLQLPEKTLNLKAGPPATPVLVLFPGLWYRFREWILPERNLLSPMVRFFLILLAIAVIIWCVQHYFIEHPGGSAHLDSNGDVTYDASPGTASSPSPTPVDHSISGCRTNLLALTQKVLGPLDSKGFSASEAAQMLRETENDLSGYKIDPDYKRLMQACALLGQALQERQNYMLRFQRDSATPAPASASAQPAFSTSKLQTSSLQTSGLQPMRPGADSTTEFFKNSVIAEWKQRCASYRPVLDGLLSTTS